jgi:hypothetical protein
MSDTQKLPKVGRSDAIDFVGDALARDRNARSPGFDVFAKGCDSITGIVAVDLGGGLGLQRAQAGARRRCPRTERLTHRGSPC